PLIIVTHKAPSRSANAAAAPVTLLKAVVSITRPLSVSDRSPCSGSEVQTDPSVSEKIQQRPPGTGDFSNALAPFGSKYVPCQLRTHKVPRLSVNTQYPSGSLEPIQPSTHSCPNRAVRSRGNCENGVTRQSLLLGIFCQVSLAKAVRPSKSHADPKVTRRRCVEG